jgi:phage terminase large subunit-like protein
LCPIKVIRDLVKDPNCIVTTGSTMENAKNLAPSFLEAILRKYQGTRLGRQEILAEILEDIAGAVFQRAWIDSGRRSASDLGIGKSAVRPEHMERMCVAIDPAMTTGEDSNETGIVVAGRDHNRHGYVFDDASGRMAPSEWVNTAVRLYNLWECDYIVAEVNNGGAMIANAIHQVDGNIRVKEVVATRGKIVRAEPVGMIYEQGRGHHIGSFPEMEDQMCRFTPDFIRKPDDSPDRMDALVWAFTDLIVEPLAGAGMFQYTKELAEEMAARLGLKIIDGGLAA